MEKAQCCIGGQMRLSKRIERKVKKEIKKPVKQAKKAVKTQVRQATSVYCSTCLRKRPINHTCEVKFTKTGAARRAKKK